MTSCCPLDRSVRRTTRSIAWTGILTFDRLSLGKGNEIDRRERWRRKRRKQKTGKAKGKEVEEEGGEGEDKEVGEEEAEEEGK